MYEYRCEILKVIDGDTVDVRVDLGFDIAFAMRIRLAGINAPEMRTPEGVAARNWLIEHLPVGSTCDLITEKDRREKYGRYLGWLHRWDNGVPAQKAINLLIYEAGHAVKYHE